MLIRQLEYFVAVAREQHFGRAAEACYVSQPALSAAIVKLERELNVTLIKRGQHFEGLTPEGARLVGRATRLLDDHEQMKVLAAELHSGPAGVLRLGIGPTVSSTATAQLVARFCSVHAAVTVQVTSVPASCDLLAQLSTTELDVAIAHFEHTPPELISIALYQEEYVLVGGAGLIPAVRTMTWAQASTLPLALTKPATESRQLIEKVFASVGVAPAPRIETDSLADLYAHVATGEHAALVPRTWLRVMPMTMATRVVRLVQPDTTEKISVGMHTDSRSIAGRAFLDIVTRDDPVEALAIDGLHFPEYRYKML